MPIYDKNMSKSERESLELAEDARQSQWHYPSFVSRLFQGKVEWNLVHPYPEEPKAEREACSEYIKKLEEFLKKNLDPDKVDETREIPENVIKGLFDMGAFAIKIPKEYGGLGMSYTSYNRIIHLIGSYCGSTTALLSAHQSIGVPQPLITFGTEEQKKKFLPRFREGAISGFALTEEEAGSDPRRMTTTATPSDDGKYYILNGEKLWCTNGNVADILVVMALTPPKIVHGKEKRQISAFIVETNTPGFEVVHRCKFMGLNAIQNGVMRFTNVKIPKENILIGEGEGLKLAFVTLNAGRLSLPAAVTGMSKWALKVSRNWANERKQWGSAIGGHEAVSSKLSTMAARVFAMDAMTWLVSHMAYDKHFDIRMEAAMAKLFTTEESWKVLYEAIQVRGGRGYETSPSLKARGVEAHPLERAMRDARINTILEGSSEIMHLFIAREALDFHLKSMMPLFNPHLSIVKKLSALVAMGFKYLFWYPTLYIPTLGGCPISSKALNGHTAYVKRSSKRLARKLFHKMALYQKALAKKENLINRFVDIGTELFAISAACSYAEKLAKEGKANAVKLADLYCIEARKRVNALLKEVDHNTDKPSRSVAKDVLSGAYSWMEEDIIK